MSSPRRTFLPSRLLLLLLLLLLSVTAAVVEATDTTDTTSPSSSKQQSSESAKECHAKEDKGEESSSSSSSYCQDQPESNSSNNADVDANDKNSVDEFLELWDSYGEKRQLVQIEAIKKWMGCDQIIEDPDAYTNIPKEDDYRLMVEAYTYAMAKNNNNNNHGKENDDDDDDEATKDKNASNNNNKYNNKNNNNKQQEPSQPSISEYNPNVFSVPVEVRAIPHIGRGIFATEDISEGTMIYKPTNAAEFSSNDSIRDFLAYLIRQKFKFACDSLMWSYSVMASPPNKNKQDDYIVCIDIDDSSLFNSYFWDDGDDDDDDDSYDDDSYDEDEDDPVLEIKKKEELKNDDDSANRNDDDDDDDDYEYVNGDDDDEDEKKLNVGQRVFTYSTYYGEERTLYGCQDPPMYALRDIKAGEELLMDYSNFSEPEGFKELGIQF